MVLDIEQAFPVSTRICINCDKRPIREGGIINCQVCADMITAKRMDQDKIKMKDETESKIMIDEDHPEVVEYINHNAMGEHKIVLDPTQDWTGHYDPI